MNRGRFLYIISAIIASVLLGMGFYFILTKRNPPAVSSPAQNSTPTSTPTEEAALLSSPSMVTPYVLSPDEIAQWKTYEDTSFGFRLRYPTNFVIYTPYDLSSRTPPEQLQWRISIPGAIQSSEVGLGWLNWSVHNLLEDSETREWVAALSKNPEATIMKFGRKQMIKVPDTGGMYRSFGFILLDRDENKAVSFGYTGVEETDEVFYTILSSFELFTPTTNLKINTRNFCEVNRKPPNDQVAAESLKSACASETSQDTCEQTDVYESKTETFGISDGFHDCVWHTYYGYSHGQ